MTKTEYKKFFSDMANHFSMIARDSAGDKSAAESIKLYKIARDAADRSAGINNG